MLSWSQSSKRYSKLQTLSELYLINDLVDGLRFCGTRAAYRFIDLEIDPGVTFHTDNSEEDAERLGGFSAFAYNLSHVVRMNREREQYAHLINSARSLDRFRVIDQRFDCVFKKCLIWFHRYIGVW